MATTAATNLEKLYLNSYDKQELNASNTTFGSDNPQGNIIMGAVFLVFVILTIIGNLLVIIAMKIDTRLRTVFNLYVLNLAITDLLVACTAMACYSIHTVLGIWPFGSILCTIWIFLDYVFTFASAFTVILISVDRYWAVKYSIHYRNNHSVKTCATLIALVWVTSVLLWIAPCLLDRFQIDEIQIDGNITVTVDPESLQCYWSPEENQIAAIMISLLGYHGPTFVMIYCYVEIVLRIRKQSQILHKKSVRMFMPWNVFSKIDNTCNNELQTEQVEVTNATCAAKAGEKRNLFQESPESQDEDQDDCISVETVDTKKTVNFTPTRSTIIASFDTLSDYNLRQARLARFDSRGDIDSISPRTSPFRLIFEPETPVSTLYSEGTGSRRQLLQSQSSLASLSCLGKLFRKERSADIPTNSIYAYGGRRKSTVTSSVDKSMNSLKNRRNSTMEQLTHRASQLYQSLQPNKSSKQELVRRKSQSAVSKMRKERRLFFTLSVIVIAYCICWCPFHVLFDFLIFDEGFIPNWIHVLCYWLAYLNSTVNPALYALTHREFRAAFARLLSCRIYRRQ